MIISALAFEHSPFFFFFQELSEATRSPVCAFLVWSLWKCFDGGISVDLVVDCVSKLSAVKRRRGADSINAAYAMLGVGGLVCEHRDGVSMSRIYTYMHLLQLLISLYPSFFVASGVGNTFSAA